MGINPNISLHLEHDSVEASVFEMPENDCAYLTLSNASGYGELVIFFPYRSLAEVREIARLFKQATAPLSKSADAEAAAGGPDGGP